MYLSRALKTIPLILLLVVTYAVAFAQPSLSPLASIPDWSKLEQYQNTITRQQFLKLLDQPYIPKHHWKKWMTVTSQEARIATREGYPDFVLQFAASPRTAQPVLHPWKSRSHLPPLNPTKPLAGLHITLDPGHLGGKWAIMEERWFRVGNGIPIKEGDMTLRVAKILAPRLRALGATVTFTRSQLGPSTSYRPKDFRSLAASELRMKGLPVTADMLQTKSEELFYRVAEIRNRARKINEDFHPDLVLCLHFNAEEWEDKQHPRLVPQNHLHFLVTGAVSKDEFSKEDQRFDILVKLLSRTDTEEIPIANALAKSMARETGLPPYRYKGDNAIRVDRYVWGRNLLATRLFQCPVVFVEAYVMNSLEVVARVQAGDFSGTKSIGGIPKKSIYREYADGIVAGLIQYYSSR